MEIIIYATPEITATRPGRLISVGSIRSEISPDAENSNCSVELDNGDGFFSSLFTSAPVGYSCSIFHSDNMLFSGVITSITLSATCSINLEA